MSAFLLETFTFYLQELENTVAVYSAFLLVSEWFYKIQHKYLYEQDRNEDAFLWASEPTFGKLVNGPSGFVIL